MATLTIAVATPLPPGIAEHLVERETPLPLRYDPDLLPPMRHPADFAGDPSVRRTPAQPVRRRLLRRPPARRHDRRRGSRIRHRRTGARRRVAKRTGRFAVFDVFVVEPLPAHSPLLDLPNVLVSPHTAALSAQEDRRIAEHFARNARRLLDGEELLNRIDVKEFY